MAGKLALNKLHQELADEGFTQVCSLTDKQHEYLHTELSDATDMSVIYLLFLLHHIPGDELGVRFYVLLLIDWYDISTVWISLLLQY